ncbi:ATP-binding cassette sub-family A member 12 isoform X1 [Fukomys damarensis]|uniref:ATP-binding cassette sub-family A member 12 isoform X1 n=1 Tax=Fukomys damarensis TaxID=885580 RepID=UPI00053F39AD|nr:ATP-binding cassette sub-family A member 12 isoform X1 [Fukomys damarensis]XP_010614325.1 ATP-binding cassette sub-family A member 12 isoform X1 [Fukomys damarensis]XP_010614326.1 ATP-binding cassette sub-family A member 12 isoform X1 [Fukomys damarensis]XP_010614327.1 ATP-binding cassette sub-family A member 12 isoform X1 [Fukomys damarensis]
MASQLHQLRVLVWKNWLGVKRQPFWTLVLILWPVIIFIILAITRTKFPPTAKPTCYLAPRNLPSTGFFPFLQTLLCDTDSKCKDTPYGPLDLLRRKGISEGLFKDSELRKKSSNLKNSNLPLQGTQVPDRGHTSLATIFPSPASDLESTGALTFNGSQVLEWILGLEKLIKENSTSGDIRKEVCERYPGYRADYTFSWTAVGKNILNKFCLSNMTVLESSLQEMKEQFSQVSSDPTNQKLVLQDMVKVLSFFSKVQEQTALWQLLSSFPDVFRNDTSLGNLFDVLRKANGMLLALQKVYPQVETNEGFRTLQKSVKHLLYTLHSPTQGDFENTSYVWSEDDGRALSPSSLAAQLLILENFEDAILNISSNSPYFPYLACVRYVTNNLARGSPENLRLLQSTIRFKKSFLRNGSYEDYFPSIPEVLKSKLSQLRNLTELLCESETFNSIEKACWLSNTSFGSLCEDSVFHLQLLKAAELGTDITTSFLYHDNIISEKLRDLLTGDINKINLNMDRFLEQALQMNYLENITQLIFTIEGLLHVNSSADTSEQPDQLIEMFKNVDELKEELRRTTGMSNTSINKLLAVPIPDNRAEIISRVFWLHSCDANSTNPKLEDAMMEFCSLPFTEQSSQSYHIALTLLHYLDIYNFAYKMFFPGKDQKPVEKMFELFRRLKEILNQVASGTHPLLDKMRSLKQMQLPRSAPLTQAMYRSNRMNTPQGSFSTISQALCSQGITTEYLTAMLPSSQKPKGNHTKDFLTYKLSKKQVAEKYGIPLHTTPFCFSLYKDIINMPAGPVIWAFLKPMLLGKILYAPYNPVTKAIMEKSNATLRQLAELREKSQEWVDKSPIVMNSFYLMKQAIPMLQNTLKNPFVQVFVKFSVGLDAVELLKQIEELDTLRLTLKNNIDIIDQLNTLSSLTVNISSCVLYDRIQPAETIDEMEREAKRLYKSNELFGSVIFKLPSNRSWHRGYDSENVSLPPVVKYTIRMSLKTAQTTRSIRTKIWAPGPHNSPSHNQIYGRAFVYLQDSIERAIVELQTGRNSQEIAVQVQAVPYPCYMKDNFLTSVSYSLPIVLMVAWVVFIAVFVKKLVYEKDLRLHEYMKMMGVNSCSHFFAWLIESVGFLLVTITILIIILKFGNILPKTDGFILFLYFSDYSFSVIAMSYLISVFFNNTNIAALIGSLIYVIAFFPFIVLITVEDELSYIVKVFVSLLSPTAFSYASQYIARYEEQGIGLQWENMYSSPVQDDTTSFGWLCCLILADSFIYFFIAWYVRNVFPGTYGMAAPWYFPILPSYWKERFGCAEVKREKSNGLMFTNIMMQNTNPSASKTSPEHMFPSNIEPEPKDLPIGVALHGVTKIYGTKVAVDNLNLNFYEGHITSLLGPNGAGKTTTISMLTGLFGASAGTIFVYGKDIKTDLGTVRKSMGVCMQHDVLFSYLTTKEHLLLYGSIKVPHWTKKQLHEEVKKTLKETGLYSHRHKRVGTLSGGMKRKLSISIALIGGSRVVILDEPSTGVDPCSRRSIWDVISKNKTARTIILSTHHLDEAEVLSDRIAFLEQGGLRCCGSPFYLKEAFGDGYHLTLTKKKSPSVDANTICDTMAVTAMIRSHLPEACLKEDIGGELVYVLPPFSTKVSGAYLSLLRALDQGMGDLNIGCYGISDTTVEEVFLNLTKESQKNGDMSLEHITQRKIGNSNTKCISTPDDLSVSSSNFTDRDDKVLTNGERLDGFGLLLKKIVAILIKRFHHTRRNWKGLIAQVVLPIVFVTTAMGLGTLRSSNNSYPEIQISPSLYGTSEQTAFYANYHPSTKPLVSAMWDFPGIDNICLNSSNLWCLKENSLSRWNTSGEPITNFGVCSCSENVQECPKFNYSPPHRRIYSSQMIYNLTVTGRHMENYLISTANKFSQKRYGGWSFGLPLTNDLRFDVTAVPANRTLAKVWYDPEGYHSLPAYLNSLNNFLLRVNMSKVDAAKHGIIMYSHPYPGVRDQEQATISSLIDILVALSILMGYSVTTASFVTYVVREHQTKAKQLQHISGIGVTCYWVTNFIYDMVFYLVPVAFSIGVIAIFKLPAFYSESNLAAVSLLLLLFGYATFSWMYLLAGFFHETGMAFITYVCVNLFFGINSIVSLSVVYFLSKEKPNDPTLELISETLKKIFLIFPQFCFGYGLIELSQQQSVLDFLKAYGVEYPHETFEMDKLGAMFVALVSQGTLFFLLRLLINEWLIKKLRLFFRKFSSSPVMEITNEDEDVRAERLRVESGAAEFDLVQLHRLTKTYQLIHKKIIAVNNISIGIPAGECFGLLGVNGAGKTTIFKMLTGDIVPSSGNILIRNKTGSLGHVDSHSSLVGYCPQEDALDDLVTVEEHLYFYARVHGIPEKDIKETVHKLLRRLHLMLYKDRSTSMCSYGTKRKLSTALALIGKPSILLLDEPSSGMDPKSKRHLWKIISEEVQNKCSVILTSHSMEECEALCTRLAIMVNGRFQCIGSLQHIKSRFGRGFTVKVHLKNSKVSMETLTRFMQLHFPKTYLKDQHLSMLEYHVPVTAGGVANIFDLLETNKTALNITNFLVSQTTLEEVFINFAKDQKSYENADTSSQGSTISVDSQDDQMES